MNKTKTPQVSPIEQPNFGCSRYVLGKIEETAAVLIIDI
jgi:hypothetical protein